jgi:hypothetical protein
MTIWNALMMSGVATIWVAMLSAVAYRARVAAEPAGDRAAPAPSSLN